MNLGKVNPKHLVYASGACLSLGVILPLLIVTHVIINTPMALLFFIYILQVIGIVIGIIGIFSMVRKSNEK